MSTLTLLIKISSDKQLKQIGKVLELAFEGLEVESKILGVVADGWVQIALAGEDEEIAKNYVIKEIGICPSSFWNIKNFSTLKGYISNIEKEEELLVAVGVFEPKVVHATIPLRRLQVQLADGRNFALEKMTELFGLCKGLPVNVKFVRLSKEESCIEAELSKLQVESYRVWRESLLDRLIVLGAPLYEMKRTMDYARLNRDIIRIESLGMLEHVLTCKLGTDAAGLIPKIDRVLKGVKFVVFNPKILRATLEA